jgi:hypothetical protein
MTRPGLAVAAAVVLAAGAGCVVWPEGAGPNAAPMPAAEALALREQGKAVFIDVRSSRLWIQGHIPGALNVPIDTIESRALEIRGMGKLPILYCG